MVQERLSYPQRSYPHIKGNTVLLGRVHDTFRIRSKRIYLTD